MKKTIAINTFSQLIGKAVSMCLTIGATAIITRTYGKLGYGEFSIMQTLPALFYILADFGLNTTTIKLIKSAEEMRKYYGTVFFLRLVISFGLVVILNAICLFLPYSPFLKTGIAMSSLLIVTQALYSTTNLIFQYKKRYDLSALGYILGSSATIVMVVILLTLGLDVRYISFSYVIGGLLTFITSVLKVKKLGYGLSPSLDLGIMKTLLKGSLPLGLMFVFSQINFKSDIILLSILHLPGRGDTNIEAVALYSLPYKVFEVMLVLPTFIMNSVFPLLVEKMHQGLSDFKSMFKYFLKYLIGLGATVSILLYVLAPYIIQLLGKETFGESINILRILSVGLIIFFITQPFSYLIVILNKQRLLPFIYLAGAIVNVLGNLIFIPIYGMYASAFLTWISELVILSFLLYYGYKSLKENNNG